MRAWSPVRLWNPSRYWGGFEQFTIPTVTPPPVPDTYAPQTTIGRVLVDAMHPWITEALAMYLDAAGAMFQQIATLVLDHGFDGDPDYIPGYGRCFDPDLASGSELRYLGQFVGVPVPDGLDDDTARALVLAEGGFQRGTRGAVESAVKRNLAGSQSVKILERVGPLGPDPYWFTIIVRPEELVDAAALIDAVNAIKPSGVLFQLIEAAGFTWAEAIHLWSEDAITWAESATTQP